MTYSEFFEIAKDKPWKVIPCHAGTECWCRIITVEEFERPDNEDSHISSWGSISKEFAEYLVELHNQNLKEPSNLRFNTNQELFEYLNEECLSTDLITNNCVSISDFDDSAVEKEVEARGYYYFEHESDIKDYVEDDMNLYVFGQDSEIIDWIKENTDELEELTTSAPAGMYRTDCISLVNEIVEEHGWEWFHRRLELM